MSDTIIFEIPATKENLFTEAFQLAINHPDSTSERKSRILQLYADVFQQKNSQPHFIYSDVSKEHLKAWLNDLVEYHRNAGKMGLASNVQHLINML